MLDLSDRMSSQGMLQQVGGIKKDVTDEEERFIERCRNKNIKVSEHFHSYTRTYRYIVFIKKDQEVPGLKKLLDAYNKYSEKMKAMAKEEQVKSSRGQRRVSIPKWIDGTPITDKKPNFRVHKITYRSNDSFVSAPVNLSEAIKHFENQIKKQEKWLAETISDGGDCRIIEAAIRELRSHIDFLNGFKASGKRFTKDTFRLRRFTGTGFKITASYYDKKGKTKSISKTTSNIIFVPVTDDFVYRKAFQRNKDVSYIKILDCKSAFISTDFDIYADYKKIEPVINLDLFHALDGNFGSLLTENDTENPTHQKLRRLLKSIIRKAK